LYLGHYFPQDLDAWIALLLASYPAAEHAHVMAFPSRWRGALMCWAMVTVIGASLPAAANSSPPARRFCFAIAGSSE
jgi:hypothetical protein